MTEIAVVRDVFDALGRMTVSTPRFIDDSQLAEFALYGWRTLFGVPVAPLTEGQIPTITMSPTDIRPWGLNWGPWLNGDSIATSLWLPGNSSLILANPSKYPTTTNVWLSIAPGVTSLTCLLTNRITTSGGREDDQSVTVIVAQR
ncbi:hypothetical protein [Nocardia sp. NPDC046763]|uniref:phage fiber-tail adaptor protein n=1 Tax=Nocardia sp. NPDC046763 TaxID=3155256 RepID=UPI003401CA71